MEFAVLGFWKRIPVVCRFPLLFTVSRLVVPKAAITKPSLIRRLAVLICLEYFGGIVFMHETL